MNDTDSFVLTDEDEPKDIERKPTEPSKYKYSWVVILAVIVLFVLLIVKAIDYHSKQTIINIDNDYVGGIETVAFNETEEQTQVFTEPPTEDPIQVEKKFKDECETVEIKNIARTPDDYVNKQIKVTGVVTSVSGRSSTLIVLKPLVSDGISYRICVEVFLREGDTRIFEGDTLTCWGVLEGTELYVQTNNQTVELPTLDLEYYEIK